MDKSKTKNILEEMNELIFGRSEEQERQYGPFLESISKTSEFASILCDKKIDEETVFKVLIALKMSRLSYNSKRDTIKDAIGYLAGLDELYKITNEGKDGY